MRRISKAFYLGSYAGSIVLGLLFGVMKSNGLLFLCMVYIMFVFLRLIYVAWDSIQDGHARSNPVQAFAFFFIPFFNLYWEFVAIWGFSKDYNAYIDRHGLQAKKLPEDLFLWACILSILTFFVGGVRFVGDIAALALLIVFMIMISRVCDAVNSIPVQPAVSE